MTTLRALLAKNTWHVTCPDRGDVVMEADSLALAEQVAAGASRFYGFAMVVDQDGLVATYVSGVLLGSAE